MSSKVFIDGTWLYYSLVAGRGTASSDPVARKFGTNWKKSYGIDWLKFPKLIADNISQQLKRQNSLRQGVEVTRTSVFTSLRADTASGDARELMVSDFRRANFDVHR